ncbi:MULTISPECIES: EamA family transporter [unclassified Leifsonia]|uniref:EamA family transporter n=1 Tax=unclassified Leifsonia TaxID=2663824 RepID=UPI0006FA3812|nr:MULTISPECIES: DMT family transporter [unclassified Leifsonia]KQX05060.1 multidrug DMT transporter permease [Leifsonia sp. Root1293]KRA08692.1 multidrug DMT transporter permease [Leifsonia sp. Root60]
MRISSRASGLAIAVLAAASFGTSGVLMKPLLEAGWSPAAAVTARAVGGAIILLPITLIALRGRWNALWRARWRVLVMGVVGVASTQFFYFAAIRTVPVSTAILIELLAPLLLVAVVWARTLRMPRPLVLAGSGLAIVGLVMVIGPGSIGAPDPVGLLFSVLAMVACAVYFVIAARPSDGLPAVAFAGVGLVIGALTLSFLALIGVLPFTATFGDLPLFGAALPWWVPLLFVAVVSTALAYVAGITAAESLGSRLASFAGLLEVVFAALFAWILLGEQLQPLQLVGGALILGGIAAVRASEPMEDADQAVPATVAANAADRRRSPSIRSSRAASTSNPM